jgi:hypothetical protein
MAVIALYGGGIIVPCRRFDCRTMELIAVALGAGHTFLSPVDIGGKSFIIAEVFVADAGAVTGHAVILHRGSRQELMVGNEATI